MTAEPQARLLVTSHDDLGESPVWDRTGNCLRWTDITGRAVRSWDSETDTVESIDVDQEIGFLVPCADGGWLAGARDGLARLRESQLHFTHRVDSRDGTHRLNDGKADPLGRVWFGTMAFDAQAGEGALHRLSLDGTITTVLDGLNIPNGLGWSADATTMYFVESTEQRIDRFDIDIDTGNIVGRDVLVDLSQVDGVPDGLCVDGEDHVWVAMWGGSHVRRIRPDGSLDLVVTVPASQPTSICIGGRSGRQAFVTTAAYQLPAATALAEGAGHIYTFEAPAPGVPAHRAAVGC